MSRRLWCALRCGHSRIPQPSFHGVAAAGVASTLVASASPGRCEMATVSVEPQGCSVISKLREKLARCQSTKMDKQLSIVHDAERRLLDMMPASTPYEVTDVRVQVEGFGSRCALFGPESELSIHTVIVGAEHKDKVPIVLVHGFMMGAGSFWKLLPELARERTVYAIDIIGMAGSSRPAFDTNTLSPGEIEELLYKPFECWAEALQIKEFVLLGHSFGGLVSAYWATHHPERIACLGLLSPLLGFSDERINAFASAMQNKDAPWQRRAFFSIIECAWSNHITPQSLVRWLPGFKGLVGRATERRYQATASGINEEEGKMLSTYVVATMDTPASTEAAGPALFEPFLRPVEMPGGTIKSRLAHLDLPLFAIYGDRDWMEMPLQGEMPNCEFIVLEDSGHHLALDAPRSLAVIVLERLGCLLKD